MKRLLVAVLFLTSLLLPAHAADKAGTVLIHPGETVYARFEVKGKKIKLVSYSKDKDEAAQVIFTLGPDAKKPTALITLKVENKFTQDLTYELEARSLSLKQKHSIPPTPVVGGKVSFENYPKFVEELAASEFRLVQ